MSKGSEFVLACLYFLVKGLMCIGSFFVGWRFVLLPVGLIATSFVVPFNFFEWVGAAVMVVPPFAFVVGIIAMKVEDVKMRRSLKTLKDSYKL